MSNDEHQKPEWLDAELAKLEGKTEDQLSAMLGELVVKLKKLFRVGAAIVSRMEAMGLKRSPKVSAEMWRTLLDIARGKTNPDLAAKYFTSNHDLSVLVTASAEEQKRFVDDDEAAERYIKARERQKAAEKKAHQSSVQTGSARWEPPAAMPISDVVQRCLPIILASVDPAGALAALTAETMRTLVVNRTAQPLNGAPPEPAMAQ